MSEAIRLDKRVAALFGCSRAEARQYVEGGWVSVDGEVVEAPQAMVSTEVVTLHPEARPQAVEPATMLLHKPAGESTDKAATRVHPASHFAGDASGVRMLKRHFHRPRPLMPLDTEASGLLVLSQDGRVVRRLTEDYALIEQEFVVEVRGELAPYSLHRLAHGLSFEGRVLPPCKVSWQSETRLRFAIKAPQPGQLRHVCAAVGLDAVALKRIRIGRVSLGKMPAGEWRYQPASERF